MNGTTVTFDAQVILTWVTLVVAVVGAVVAVSRWTVRSLDAKVRDLHEKMETEVRRATAPIQPNANGGGSLPDVARAIASLAADNERAHAHLGRRVDKVSADVEDLQVWAGGRPCLLDVHQRAERARQLLRQEREAGSNDDAACEHDA